MSKEPVNYFPSPRAWIAFALASLAALWAATANRHAPDSTSPVTGAAAVAASGVARQETGSVAVAPAAAASQAAAASAPAAGK